MLIKTKFEHSGRACLCFFALKESVIEKVGILEQYGVEMWRGAREPTGRPLPIPVTHRAVHRLYINGFLCDNNQALFA